jgi:hypothetical protein
MAALAPSFFMVMVMAACLTIGVGSGSGGSSSGGGSDRGGGSSSDGGNNGGGSVSWTAVSDSTFGEDTIYRIAWGGAQGQEKFVAGGGGWKMAYSSDGVTWTAVSGSPFDSSPGIPNGIAWGGANGQEKFVAVGQTSRREGKDTIYTPRAAYSADGITWTAVNDSKFGSSGQILGIAWGGGKFVAWGGNGAYSADGVSWTAVNDSTFGTTGILGIA